MRTRWGTIAAALIALTGPGGQHIYVNPHRIVSLREPRDHGHFAPDVHCLVHTQDGKFISVIETCGAVRSLASAPPHHRTLP